VRMNSPTGKQILSIVRDGDYAHPGEEEAVELALGGFRPDDGRNLLDVGCGRGGTAHYLYDRGWGNVVGVDIDEASIDHARAAYPEVEFLACDVSKVSARLSRRFDLICLFSSFYAFGDQPAALGQLLNLAAPGGSLVLFDYLDLSADGNSLLVREDASSNWNPVKLDHLDQLFGNAGWAISETRNISAEFADWYRDLVSRIEHRQDQIVDLAGPAWYRFVRDFYGGMLESIERQILGGVVVTAGIA